MDYCCEMLYSHLPRSGVSAVAPEIECPSFRRIATRLPGIGNKRFAFNADRLRNRFFSYPRHCKRIASNYDFFHIVDHSYSQLALSFPSASVGIYCHDLDAYRCLIDPVRAPRPAWFRALVRRQLAGLQKASLVFLSTLETRVEVIKHGLIDESKLIHAPLGVAAEFVPEADDPTPDWLRTLSSTPWIAHVGSCVPRKRIDILLSVFASARSVIPDLKLLKVGGKWSDANLQQISQLGIANQIIHVTDVSRSELASVYRQAGAILMPSEAEGFGLPVIEALSCGGKVIASDLPVLREVGGSAVLYAPVGDVEKWSGAVVGILSGHTAMPTKVERLAWSSRYTWKAHAETIANAYHSI